jgi:D12 class N6 adenine-specific DNA methyltransferase
VEISWEELLRRRTVHSPLRYPGGKRRLVPYVAALLQANALQPDVLVEPFAGGASVAPLKVARIRNGHETEIPLRKPLLEEQERLIGQRGHRCTEYQPPSLREDLSRSATLRHPMWGSEPPQ